MAESLVLSLTEYFGLPFFPASTPQPGEVRVDLGVLDVYARPSYDSALVAQLYDGARVTVVNEYYAGISSASGTRWAMQTPAFSPWDEPIRHCVGDVHKLFI